MAAVKTRRRSRDKNKWAVSRELAHRLDKRVRAVHAAAQNRILACRRPADTRNAFARKIDDDIHPTHCFRSEFTLRRIPKSFIRRLHRPPHEPHYGVSLRLQKRNQRPPHQSRSPGDQKLHRPHRNIPRRAFDVGFRNTVPIRKQPRQFRPRKPLAKNPPEPTKRQPIGNRIGQQARVIHAVGRIELMFVFPLRERPVDLHVAKLNTFDVVAVLHVPPHPHGPDLGAQAHRRSVANAAAAGYELQLLPRRSQTLERPRLLMPRKHLGGRLLDTNPAGKRKNPHGMRKTNNSNVPRRVRARS